MRLFVLTLAGLLAIMASAPKASAEERATAIFAGGCFWCVESDFDQIPGVLETISGYAQGQSQESGSKQVASRSSGRREAVRITFDPSKVSYEALLTTYWRSIDPTDDGGQSLRPGPLLYASHLCAR